MKRPGLILPVPQRCWVGVNSLTLGEHRWAPGMCKKTFVAIVAWHSVPSGLSILGLSHQHLARSI